MAKKTGFLVFLAIMLSFTLLGGCEWADKDGNDTAKRSRVPFDGIEWGNDKAVYAAVHPGYANQAIQDAENASGAFASLDIKAVYVVGKYLEYDLRLLLVLHKAGEEEQEAAIDILRADSRIMSAYKCNDAPFETVNTLYLSASSDTVNVGDTLTVKPEGTLKVYCQALTRFGVVSLVNYDPNKQYTPADFPQVEIESVYRHDPYFDLTLVKSGYFDIIKAIDALARDSAIKIIDGYVIHYDYPQADWSISDASVADFIKQPFGWDGEIFGWEVKPNENGEVTIEALKPGKATVSYTPSMGRGYTVTHEITVLP
jgi:hypothetical protein